MKAAFGCRFAVFLAVVFLAAVLVVFLAAVLVVFLAVVEVFDRITRDADRRVRYHYVLVDYLCWVVSGELRPVTELPVTSAAGSDLGRVVRGEQPSALATGRPGGEVTGALIVPLRVAGRITGALILHAAGPDGFSRPDAALAQQIADVLAPHVELGRRPHGPGPAVPVPPSIRRPASYG